MALGCQILQRNLFPVFRRKEQFSIKFDSSAGHSSFPLPPRHFLFQGFAGLYHCISGHIGRTGCVGTGVVRRNVGIHAVNRNLFQLTFQTFRRHLGQYRITACPHICRTDEQVVGAVIAEADFYRRLVKAGNSRALHRQRTADRPDFAVSISFAGYFASQSIIAFARSRHFFRPTELNTSS